MQVHTLASSQEPAKPVGRWLFATTFCGLLPAREVQYLSWTPQNSLTIASTLASAQVGRATSPHPTMKKAAKAIGLITSTSRKHQDTTPEPAAPVTAKATPAPQASIPQPATPEKATPPVPKPAVEVNPADQRASSERGELELLHAELKTTGRMDVRIMSRILKLPESGITEVGYVDDVFDLGSDPIGSGQCSTVFEATTKDDRPMSVALKLFDISTLSQTVETLSMARAEVQAMKALPKHPNLVQLLAILCTPSELCLSLELLPAGDLLSHILDNETGLMEAESCSLFRQLAVGLSHMHGHGEA